MAINPFDMANAMAVNVLNFLVIALTVGVLVKMAIAIGNMVKGTRAARDERDRVRRGEIIVDPPIGGEGGVNPPPVPPVPPKPPVKPVKEKKLNPPTIRAEHLGNRVLIEWDPVIGAKGYLIEKKAKWGWNRLHECPYDAGKQIQDADVKPTETYKYRIQSKAVKVKYDSDWNEVSATPGPLNKIDTPAITAVHHGDKVALYWTYNDEASEYILERDSGSGFSQIFKGAYQPHMEKNPMLDTKEIEAGKEYKYRVKATASNKADSDWGEATAKPDIIPLITPALTAEHDGKVVKLTWEKVKDATEYIIERNYSNPEKTGSEVPNAEKKFEVIYRGPYDSPYADGKEVNDPKRETSGYEYRIQAINTKMKRESEWGYATACPPEKPKLNSVLFAGTYHYHGIEELNLIGDSAGIHDLDNIKITVRAKENIHFASLPEITNEIGMAEINNLPGMVPLIVRAEDLRGVYETKELEKEIGEESNGSVEFSMVPSKKSTVPIYITVKIKGKNITKTEGAELGHIIYTEPDDPSAEPYLFDLNPDGTAEIDIYDGIVYHITALITDPAYGAGSKQSMFIYSRGPEMAGLPHKHKDNTIPEIFCGTHNGRINITIDIQETVETDVTVMGLVQSYGVEYIEGANGVSVTADGKNVHTTATSPQDKETSRPITNAMAENLKNLPEHLRKTDWGGFFVFNTKNEGKLDLQVNMHEDKKHWMYFGREESFEMPKYAKEVVIAPFIIAENKYNPKKLKVEIMK